MKRRSRRRKSRWIRRIAIAVLAIPAIYLLGALIGSLVPLNSGWAEPDQGITIYIADNGVHADLVLPANAQGLDWRPLVPKSDFANVPANAGWVAFGAGERRVYLETPTWADLKPLPLLKALTIDRSVLHVDVAGAIAASNPAVRGFYVDEAGQERLLAVIEASFARDAGAPVPVPDRSYGETDRFFEANASFNAFLGCNTWTAAALRAAGLRTGWWTPLPMSLVLSLDLHN